MTPPAGDDGLRFVLPKVFLASLGANLPMLILLLQPRLMRSRAGSETLLFVGATLYLALIVLAVTTAPRVSAWAAPRPEQWTVRGAGRTAREVRRARPGDYWQRVGEWLLLFVLAQAVGLIVAWLLPYVSDNPAFGAPGQPQWIVHRGNYAVQAIAVYVLSCVSFAWLGARLRQLSAERGGGEHRVT